jgi:rhodanese-related sulfurtransferase
MMGPFVPSPITDQLNLVVALFLGMGFGYVLEQAGFSSSRRLAGLFYGYDFTVLRVFFTAALTAASGVLLLAYFGLLDVDVIYINPTFLWPAIVGGAIMGVGFILGGYCPGTSICAASIGKIDALFFLLGGFLGVFGFAELFPHFEGFWNSSSLGPIRIFDTLGISQGLFMLLLIVVAVAAFAVTTLIEKRVAGRSAPSTGFNFRRHLTAAAAVVALGLVFVALPSRREHMIAEVSDPGYLASHPVETMDADELAFRIVDQEPRVQIVDIRAPEAYAGLSLPGARNLQMAEFFGKDPIDALSRRHVQKVLVADTEKQERIACLLLARLGYENLVALEGGLPAFQHTILASSAFVPTGGRWDDDVRQFRETARGQILQMIADAKNVKPKEPKKVKRVQGGC